jgi:hypothetical protein
MQDSYKKNSLDNSPKFSSSRHFQDLITNLQNNNNCIISDIDFCRQEARDELVNCINYFAPGTEVIWKCFENNPSKCEANVKYSGRAVEGRLTKIAEFSSQYTYPDGVKVIEIWDQKDDGTSAPHPKTPGLDQEDE